MDGLFLRFYLHENQRHHGALLRDWLFERAAKLGIRGGSAFRGMTGFGRHHVVHMSHFFELGGNLTVEVEFIVDEDEAKRSHRRTLVTSPGCRTDRQHSWPRQHHHR